MKTLTIPRARVIPVMCAVGIAAAALWIAGQSHAASTASAPPDVDAHSSFVQDSCVDAALKLKLMIHRAGLILNASSGGDAHLCNNDRLSVTDAESLHSASASPDSIPERTSPEQEKS
ncbi:hypothetical protein ACKVEX_05910 [Rhodocyclaceae bacterium SMB388]